ncbi:MAG: efflux transporter outer membrane subunit [Stagnimonas sp.]|nr:efflux transporter outer membrane subunit [Stagnimonas sp.]
MTTIRRTSPLFALTAVAAVLLSGCMLGPDYTKPEAPTTQRIAGKPLPAATVAAPIKGGESQRFVEGGVLPAQWWKTFGSPVLDGWVDEALAKSPSLASAEATLRQQQALYIAAGGTLYPSVTANGGATRQKTSGSAFGGGSVPGNIFNLYSASVDVNYGLDIWGGTARSIEGQLALVEATKYQTSAAYLTLVGNVVTSAVSVASAQARLKTAREIAEAYVDTVRLAQKQFDLGASARSDVIAAQTLLAQSQANIPPLEQELTAASNRLAVLLGRYPSEFDNGGFNLTALTLPQEIPVALPSTLVERRPDIAAASAQLAVASANVGVAVANRLPQLTLSASVGTQAAKPKNLFDEDIWSIGANLAAPIFDGGTLKARKDAAVAAYDGAQADYRNTVLNAFNEVADALSALDNDARRLAAQQSAFDLATESLRLTEATYRTGSATIFDVRDARLTAAAAQQNLVLALATRYQDTAALFQALGGDGWNRNTPPPEATASNTPAPTLAATATP